MKPLDGIRVTDLTGHAAGPYCTLMLALLGAEVIRIESRVRLDIQRRPHPVYGRFDVPNFDHLAGHKMSITLDLKKPDGAGLAKELVALSDVVVENFRPGVAARLGLNWVALSAINPRLVMLSLSAYGQEGPDSGRPGYAPIFAAEGGLGHMTGYPDGPPVEMRNNMDHQAGLTAAFVVLTLLEARDRSGAGGYADVAAREVAAMMVGESIVAALATGRSVRVGNGHELWCPHGVYPTAGVDCWLALAVPSDAQWDRLVEMMGRPNWCSADLATASARRARRDLVDARIAEWTRLWDGRALAKDLQRIGIPADISMSAQDIVADDHLRERGSIVRLRHPDHGERWIVGSPWRFTVADAPYERWSPSLGEHNEQVICGLLGHDKRDLTRWIDERVVY